MSLLQVDAPIVDNAEIVRRIANGDQSGEELLYKNFSRGLRFLAIRQSPQHAEDCVQEAIMTAITQIKRGKLTAADALPSYLKTILRRTAWVKNIDSKRRSGDQKTFDTLVTTHADERADPSRLLEIKEQARLMKEALRTLTPIAQEILTRFYLQEQPPPQICEEMRLTETQFRLLKCRSKQALEKAVSGLTSKPLHTLLPAPSASE